MQSTPASLAARLARDGPLDWREAARLGAAIARAVDRLHATGVVHGGIEPLTVLFVAGSVRLADPLPAGVRRDRPAHEAAAGAPLDQRGDFLALGRTLRAMLGGGAPPAPLDAILADLEELDPARRPATGDAIARALELAVESAERAAAPSPEPAASVATSAVAAPAERPPLPTRRRSGHGGLVVALGALAVLGGALGWWLWPGAEVVAPAAPAPVAAAPSVPRPGEERPMAPPLGEVLAALPDEPLPEPPAPVDTNEAVRALLDALRPRPCQRLEVEPGDTGLRLVGSTPSAPDRDALVAALGRLDDVDSVAVTLDTAGTFCRLYDILAATSEMSRPRLVDLHPRRPDYRLVEGEPLMVRVVAPAVPSHLSVDYFTADGMVVHLRAALPDAPPMPPATSVLVGDPLDDEWLQIAAPFGAELILAIAGPAPLFSERRPRIEPAAPYLDALEAALRALTPKAIAATIAIETVATMP